MLEKVKYSFIIPVLNGEKYIEKCIKKICDDLEKENLKNQAEIIIVENGSTDSTQEKIKKILQSKWGNIKLLISEKGVSRARNVGIKNATGEWIIFVDADDEWLINSMKQIEKNIKLNKDLYVYSFIKGKSKTEFNSCSKIIHKDDNECINTQKNWLISRPTLRMQAWAKIYKKQIIERNQLFFKEDLRYSEDSEFVIRYLSYCKDIMISDIPIYKYVLSEGSVMRSFDENRIKEYMKSLNYSKSFIEEKDLELKYAFTQYILVHLNIILVHDVFESNINIKFNKRIKKMQKIIQEKVFMEALKKISLKDCINSSLLPELFLKLHLYFITGLLCYLKSLNNSKKG